MANYLLSYDLNGNRPTHAEMDDHLEDSGWTIARILETVWYVGTSASQRDVFDYANEILSRNDGLIVATCYDASFKNLLVEGISFQSWWSRNR